MPLNVDSINAGTISQNGEPVKPYKVYTALLTQSGGDDLISVGQDENIFVGITYYIENNDANFNFIPYGAPNNNVGTYFVCTQDAYINTFDSLNLQYNTGAPVVTVLENTIGNVWFTYDSDGFYFVNSNGLFTENKSWTPTIVIFNDTAGLRDGEICEIRKVSSNQYTIATFDQNGTAINNQLNNTPIEIRVYN